MSRRLATLVVAGYAMLLVIVAASRGAIDELVVQHVDGHVRQLGVGLVKFDGAGPEKWAARYRRQQLLIFGLRRRLARRVRFTITSTAAIRLVFGTYADQALRVAYCESRMSTGARNGQFVGLFQMGSHERALYGDGSTALEQARAAYVYFVTSGRNWGPWQCKP